MDRLFFTSAVFIVNTDYRVSFSLLKIWTYFLWLLSSFDMFLICCYIIINLLRESAVCLLMKQDCCWNFVRFNCRNCLHFDWPLLRNRLNKIIWYWIDLDLLDIIIIYQFDLRNTFKMDLGLRYCLNYLGTKETKIFGKRQNNPRFELRLKEIR